MSGERMSVDHLSVVCPCSLLRIPEEALELT